MLEMLSRVGLQLPRWSLLVSDIVSVEHKLDLANRIVPELSRRLTNAGLEGDQNQTWLHEQLALMGPDGAVMVAPALRAWAAEEDPAALGFLEASLTESSRPNPQ